MKARSIVIADDHPFTARGMQAVLADMPDVRIVGVAANGIEAITMIKRLQPDCALLDLSMPGANGIEVYFEARRWSPPTRFVVITGMSAPTQFRQLIDAGIDGLFIKNSPPGFICSGIEQVLDGRKVIAPEVTAILGEADDVGQLSKRELEVLQCLARGRNNREIAEDLGVSPKTIDNHRTSLLRKMKVKTTAALLVKAISQGTIVCD